MPKKTLSMRELDYAVIMDVDASNVGEPASLALIKEAMADPDWKKHDPENHGVTPSQAVATMTGSLSMISLLTGVKIDKAPE